MDVDVANGEQIKCTHDFSRNQTRVEGKKKGEERRRGKGSVWERWT